MSAAEGWPRRAVLAGGAAMLGAVAAAGRGAVIRLPEVRAASGHYIGQFVDDPANAAKVLAHRFPGIRYARAERFRAPVPVVSRAAMAEQLPGFGPACPQAGDTYQPQSEDCLFLNVWVPAQAGSGRDAGLPVMVYFHGGAYTTGSVTDPLNDGAMLAARGQVVVVTVNHRLNALGYLYSPEAFPDSGNAGQLDLVCALEWVRANIAAFGGNPANVTVFGQSGGGAKIATLMAMPAAKGLFHKAITMSGQQVTASGPLNARRRTEAFLTRLRGGLDPVLPAFDLASAPLEALLEALQASDPVLGGRVYFGPVVDMRNLMRHPFWPDAPEQSADIPMLLGNTIAETRAFYPADGRVLKGLSWDNLAERVGPEMRVDLAPAWVVAQFRARYPEASPVELFHRIVTPARSWRGQVDEAEARARGGRANTFVYQLDFENAQHTDDIGLAFGTTAAQSPAREAMSAAVMDAFTRFARTGDPGWTAYDLETRATMIFDTESRVENNPRRWERELFARVPYVQPGT